MEMSFLDARDKTTLSAIFDPNYPLENTIPIDETFMSYFRNQVATLTQPKVSGPLAPIYIRYLNDDNHMHPYSTAKDVRSANARHQRCHRHA